CLFFQHIDLNVEVIKKLCEPLFDSSGIVYFGYNRTYHGGYLQVLSSNPSVIKFIFNFELDKYYVFPEITPIPQGEIQYVLWSDIIKTQPIISAVFEAPLCIGHGFSLIENHGDYLETWNFASNHENNQINRFYKDNLEYLRQFIYYL